MYGTISRRDAVKKIIWGSSAVSTLSYLNLFGMEKSKQPNIILMVADNLGRESVGYYGNHIFVTPRLDNFASEGVVFDNCLIASPLCTPARCGWNTGRHPYRVGLNNQTVPDDPQSGLSQDEITIAEILRNAGYHTALFGKWNLGYDKKFNPIYHGFDEFYGSTAGHADYYTHIYNSSGRIHFYRGITPVNDKGYFDQLFTDEAIKFLQSRKDRKKPFYMNLCFYAPHGPYQAPPGYYHSNNPDVNYRHIIEYLDKCVGRVVDQVDQLGIAEETLIVFLSDQGSSHMNNFNRDLREGGLKVVCNARWKGRIPAGKRVNTPWMHLDLYPTFAAISGAQIPDDRVLDGQNIWPLFEGKETDNDRTFCWSFNKEDAIRIGDWKLLVQDGSVVGLFNLKNDPEEKIDCSTKYPNKIAKMKQVHAKWKFECKAQQTSIANSGKQYENLNHNNSY